MNKILIDEATAKLVLKALESCDAAHITDGGHQWYDEKLVDKAITALKALADQPAQQCKWPTCQSKEAQQCKWPTCQKEEAQKDLPDLIAGALGVSRGTAYDMMREALEKQSRQERWQKIECPICGDMAIATDIPPAQRKPLTADQIRGVYEDCDAPTGGLFTIAFARAIEAAHNIKENT